MWGYKIIKVSGVRVEVCPSQLKEWRRTCDAHSWNGRQSTKFAVNLQTAVLLFALNTTMVVVADKVEILPSCCETWCAESARYVYGNSASAGASIWNCCGHAFNDDYVDW